MVREKKKPAATSRTSRSISTCSIVPTAQLGLEPHGKQHEKVEFVDCAMVASVDCAVVARVDCAMVASVDCAVVARVDCAVAAFRRD